MPWVSWRRVRRLVRGRGLWFRRCWVVLLVCIMGMVGWWDGGIGSKDVQEIHESNTEAAAAAPDEEDFGAEVGVAGAASDLFIVSVI